MHSSTWFGYGVTVILLNFSLQIEEIATLEPNFVSSNRRNLKLELEDEERLEDVDVVCVKEPTGS